MESEEKNIQLTVDLIKHLSLCLRNMRSYPPGHPFISKTLKEAAGLLRDVMSGKEELPLAFFENNLFVEDFRIDKQIAPAVLGLINTANKLDIRSITFKEGVSTEELQDLFTLLSIDKLSLEKKGGIWNIAEEMNLAHIGLNEIEFGIISKKDEVEKGTVSVSWEVFQNMLNVPENMMATLKQNPEGIADLMFQVPMAGFQDLEEGEEVQVSEEWKGLSDLDKAVQNIEKFADTLQDQYGDSQKSQYIKSLTEFIIHIKPSLEKRVEDREALTDKIGEVMQKTLDQVTDNDIVDAVTSRFQELIKEGNTEEESLAHIQRFISTLSPRQDQMERIFPAIETALGKIAFQQVEEPGEATAPTLPFSWDIFNTMIDTPDDLLQTMMMDPEGAADLMFKSPMPGMEGFSEGGGEGSGVGLGPGGEGGGSGGGPGPGGEGGDPGGGLGPGGEGGGPGGGMGSGGEGGGPGGGHGPGGEGGGPGGGMGSGGEGGGPGGSHGPGGEGGGPGGGISPGGAGTGDWKNLSNLDRAMMNVEGVVNHLLEQYSETDKARYIKGITEFLVLLKPVMAGKVADQDAFNARLAMVFRNALTQVSDKDLVDAVMSRFQEIRKQGKSENDALALVKKFVSTLAIDPERRGRIYPDIKSGLNQQLGKSPGVPVGAGTGTGEGGTKGGKYSKPGEMVLGDVSIAEAEKIRGGSAVLLAKESVEKLKSQVKEGIVADEVDNILNPFVSALNDSSPERRKWAVESIGDILVSLLEKDKFQATEKIVITFKDRLDSEESFEVYLAYVSTMERVAKLMRKKGRDEIADEIQNIFTDQISSESKRKRAIQALGKVGGTDALISLLSALWESGIYKEVRDAIVKMGKEALPLIMEIFLEAEDKTLRRRIHDLLVHIGKESIEPLRVTVDDERWYIRRDCASILGEIGDPSALGFLARFTKDPNDLVRMDAFNGIGKIGGESAEKLLIDTLKEDNPRTVIEVIRILAKIGGDLSTTALSERIEQETSERIQKELCRALAQLGNEQAIEPLQKIVKGGSFLARSKYSDDIKVNAIFALSKIGGDRVRDTIQKLTGDKTRQIQLAAQSALRRMQEAEKEPKPVQEPEAPQESEAPKEPEISKESVAPQEPETLQEPETSQESKAPQEPEIPQESKAPQEPETPQESVAPQEPETLQKPVTSQEPKTPQEPEDFQVTESFQEIETPQDPVPSKEPKILQEPEDFQVPESFQEIETPQDPVPSKELEIPQEPETTQQPEKIQEAETPREHEASQEPESLKEPEASQESEAPQVSKIPQVPETPQEPESPQDLVTPKESEPSQEPEAPQKPETSQKPETPQESVAPQEPEISKEPETSQEPEAPQVFKIPQVPETPQEPETPQDPEAPQEPDTTKDSESK
jgi:HEAT repeat protein